MTVTVWILFSLIGILDFSAQFKKMCKRVKKIYIVLFIAYQVLFALSWLGWIPQHFAQIIKVW